MLKLMQNKKEADKSSAMGVTAKKHVQVSTYKFISLNCCGSLSLIFYVNISLFPSSLSHLVGEVFLQQHEITRSAYFREYGCEM